MFAMIFLLELVEPALIAASMAVSRQGYLPAAPPGVPEK
jgi:hypothetical protein